MISNLYNDSDSKDYLACETSKNRPHTSFWSWRALRETFLCFLRREKTRNGTESSRMADGTIERNISSNNGVKSNSSGVVGPNEVTE